MIIIEKVDKNKYYSSHRAAAIYTFTKKSTNSNKSSFSLVKDRYILSFYANFRINGVKRVLLEMLSSRNCFFHGKVGLIELKQVLLEQKTAANSFLRYSSNKWSTTSIA